ncbi:MAG: TIGR04283 family arsenosugar biosynthesis glycosyltransferase [Candidatus Omnitrophica bacterium]|nr:TIGR04283 family arsenosugar biosynthesis glycosyltransferase [Candidatus Omnitrophota bacterium]
MISIVVPLFNEETVLRQHRALLHGLAPRAELIFCDGGSTDGTVASVEGIGRCVRGPRGRAVQMNRGACLAGGDILLFMHADTYVMPETLDAIELKMRRSNLVGGCLSQRIERDAFIYRMIEGYGNIRARLTGIFYGDQGIFVRRRVFEEMGGFPEVPLMEDVLFSQALRRKGPSCILPDAIIASPRRWERRGIWRTAFFYNTMGILFRFGYPLEKLERLYGMVR